MHEGSNRNLIVWVCALSSTLSCSNNDLNLQDQAAANSAWPLGFLPTGVDYRARAVADAVCPAAYRCCMAEELADNEQAGTSENNCKSETRKGWGGRFKEIDRSEKAGRAFFNQDPLRGSTPPKAPRRKK